ncbi:MAG: hypothetical protein ABFD89_26825 [Bryobacteraceae bacterium]
MSRLSAFRQWAPPFAAFVGGLSVLFLGSVMLFSLSLVRFDGRSIAWEFFRDIGIALSVAGVMACLFEVYHHMTSERRTMRDVIDTVMGDKVTPEVWAEVKELMERRNIIRKNVEIRLSLASDRRLTGNQACLTVEHDYDMHGLTCDHAEVRIEHHLDYQLRDEALNLPRFEYVEINPPGPSLYRVCGEEFRERYPDGKFCYSVTVEPRDGRPVHVHSKRSELVYIPGSYNLYSPEFSKGLRVFSECPADVDVEVWVRPLGEGSDIKRGTNTWTCDQLLLPGQGVEIKFLRKSVA